MVTGEAQILRFRTGKTAAARGDRMHGDGRLSSRRRQRAHLFETLTGGRVSRAVHVDKPGTRWVALMAMGDSSTAGIRISRHAQ